MSSKKTKTVYHYTSPEGAQAIQKSGVIKQSTSSSDCAFGRGTYLTGMGPEHGRAKIAQNNYDGIAQRKEASGNVNYAIKAQVPEHKLTKVESQRDIYVYNGDLPLNKYKHEVVKMGSKQ